jgi:hypothetical protein
VYDLGLAALVLAVPIIGAAVLDDATAVRLNIIAVNIIPYLTVFHNYSSPLAEICFKYALINPSISPSITASMFPSS